MNSLHDLLTEQLKDIYNAEHQLVKALPKMSRGASDTGLKAAIDKHLAETKGQIERLDRIAEGLEISLKGKKCKAMEGLVEEGSEVLKEDGAESIIDAALIAAAQRVEHYEISAYGSARAVAEQLGLQNVVKLLQASLDEEASADEKLTQISQQVILPASAKSENEIGEEDSSARTNARRTRGARESVLAAGRKR